MKNQFHANGSRAPVDPGGVIFELIREKGADQKGFARDVGVSPSLLSQLIQNKRRLTDAVIAQISPHTNLDGSAWRKLRDEYEKWTESHAQHVARAFKNASHLGGSVLSRPDILRAIDERSILIDPFEPENVGPASLDVTLGECLRFGTLNRGGDFADDLKGRAGRDEIVIQPGETWKIWTAERITLPSNLCAHLAARSDLTMHGILLGFGIQIDPSWSGTPFLVLSHQGDERYPMSRGEPCASVEFRVLTSPVKESTNAGGGAQ